MSNEVVTALNGIESMLIEIREQMTANSVFDREVARFTDLGDCPVYVYGKSIVGVCVNDDCETELLLVGGIRIPIKENIETVRDLL